ncbi:TonB-dependent receptor [Pyxidicoccus caerfyrddinensis]|uniref:TonB-dependent receptor n=1 Tax=Pyxidicoccus caerfyrddinensis TaxID=2709663 RepID=UPI0013DD2AB8|nr:TonB-dependent receptor [Pyxidicoccus caerfyrddinensis]
MMPRFRPILLALALGICSASALAAPQSEPASDSASPLVPPTLREDAPARVPEGFPLTAPVVVQLELTLNESGDVTDATVVGDAPPELATAALEAAHRLRFHPATSGGAPASVRLPYSYRFEPPAPRALITGRVRQKGTRKPIAGATVQAGATTAETDARGLFRLELPPGTTRLKVSAPGHQPLYLDETLADHQHLEVLYGLEPLEVNPYETVVRADRPRTEVSRITLHDQELREVPGTMGDPFRVIMLMPGVTTLASGLSYPVVRGVQPAASAFFVDGVRVPFLYHLLVGNAVVHPDFIDSLDFQVGVPSARYGSLLGGAVDAHVSRPREDGVRGSAYLDIINSGAFLEVPFPETGTTVTAAARISYTGLIVTRVANSLTAPSVYTAPDGTPYPDRGEPKIYADYWDYSARVEQRVGDEGRLRLLVMGSSDAVGITARLPGQESGGVGLLFHRVDLRGRHPLAGGEAEVGLTLGYDRLGLNFDEGDNSPGSYELTQGSVALRTGYTRELSPSLTFEAFGQLERRSAGLVATGLFRPVGPVDGRDAYSRPDILATFAGVGTQLTWRPAARWTLVPGLRVDSYHGFGLDTYVALEPRLAVRHALTDALTLKAGAGLYHQPATVLLPVPAGEMLALERGLQRAVQLSAGAEWRPSQDWELSAEAYFNPLVRTLEFNFEDVVSNVRRRGLEAEDVQGHGYTYGLELMVRRPLGRHWFGWLTYGFNQSRRFERYSRLGTQGEELGQAEGYLPYVFEQAHSVNAALSYRFAFATVGAVAHFNTGRPESGQFGYRTRREGTDAEGNPEWMPVDRGSVDRMPGFFRLDVRASRSWVFDRFVLEAYLDVFNITARKEVLSFEYGYGKPSGLKKTQVGVPVILPTLGVKGSF